MPTGSCGSCASYRTYGARRSTAQWASISILCMRPHRRLDQLRINFYAKVQRRRPSEREQLNLRAITIYAPPTFGPSGDVGGAEQGGCSPCWNRHVVLRNLWRSLCHDRRRGRILSGNTCRDGPAMGAEFSGQWSCDAAVRGSIVQFARRYRQSRTLSSAPARRALSDEPTIGRTPGVGMLRRIPVRHR